MCFIAILWTIIVDFVTLIGYLKKTTINMLLDVPSTTGKILIKQNYKVLVYYIYRFNVRCNKHKTIKIHNCLI